MTNETEVPELGYLICKNGMFYRPDSCGYTSAKSEAGRYSLNMAIDITHPNGPDGPRDGMTYIHETEVPDTRADLSDAKDARITELEAELDHWKDVAGREGVCMACRGPQGAPDPYGCTDCLNTGYCGEHHNTVAKLEAKLAKAEAFMRSLVGGQVYTAADCFTKPHENEASRQARATLAELKGGKDE